MGRNKSPAPPGAFVETDLDLIDEGKLREQLEAKVKTALRDLLDYENKTMDRSGAAVITLKIKLQRMKGSENFFDLEYASDAKVPVVTRLTQLKEAHGKLICQPSGSNEDSPDQQLFYDAHGRIIGGGNDDDPPAPAGRISKQA